jgi:superfamily II DNA or RNA helicase
MQIREYQQRTISHLLASQHEREVVCLPTGAGKTVVFTQFCKLANKKVLILVNRTELLYQTKKTLNTNCTIIAPDKKYSKLPISQTYIAMVETLARRKKLLEELREKVDVLIVDECHIGNFNKLLDGFRRIIGFSATPKSAKKRESLKDHYYNVYVPIQVGELIAQNYLVPALTFAPKTDINVSSFKLNKSGTDYDEREMGDTLSGAKYVAMLEQFIEPKRTIIYNSNIDHSILVTKHLKQKGYNAHHLDGNTPKAEREQIIQILFNQPDTILCNVGVLTFGFDCPDIEIIILNRLTRSVQLYLQMCGRGSRLPISVKKPHFKIIDMTGNYFLHGLWEDDRDWEMLFEEKSNKPLQASPYKDCDNCGAIVPISLRICSHCNTPFTIKEAKYDAKQVELIRIQTMNDRVREVVDRCSNPYQALHVIKEKIYKKHKGASLDKLNELILQILPIWCKMTKKRHTQWHKDYATKLMTTYYESKLLQTNH